MIAMFSHFLVILPLFAYPKNPPQRTYLRCSMSSSLQLDVDVLMENGSLKKTLSREKSTRWVTVEVVQTEKKGSVWCIATSRYPASTVAPFTLFNQLMVGNEFFCHNHTRPTEVVPLDWRLAHQLLSPSHTWQVRGRFLKVVHGQSETVARKTLHGEQLIKAARDAEKQKMGGQKEKI